MKKLTYVLAWVTALCLLVGSCTLASADTVYIWVGAQSSDSQDTAANNDTTITSVTVSLDGKTLTNGMCVDGSEAVTFNVTDTVTTTHTYQISTDDGATFSAFTAGDTLSSHLPASAGTLYTIYFKVTGDDKPTNTTTASYTIYYDSLSGSTITGVTVNAAGTALADYRWINGTEPITFVVTDTAATTYTYQISTDGVNFSAFAADDTLSLSNSNVFKTVYFRAVGADNPVDNVMTVSYALYFDSELPTLVCTAGTNSLLSFFAGDSYSGFVTDGSEYNVSFDGGATWVASLSYSGNNVYTYVVQYSGAGTIPAGTLAVRDRAGNVAVWGEEITITSGGSGGGISGGSGGSGSSSGTSSRTVYYASSTYDTVTPYSGVNLVVETGAMQMLVIGDEELGLTLTLYTPGNPPVPNDQASFVAGFTGWNSGGTETTDATDETDVDTLVLTAADAIESDGDYCWTFDGSVYKKLAASGIDYLVFSTGDQATALSTAGFTAGIRYNIYRAAGLASKSFVYSITMGSGGLQVQVTVDGDTYTLTDDQSSDFYYYDLYTGSIDMLNMPFGQVSGGNTASSGGQE
jgi:hypothetical protein